MNNSFIKIFKILLINVVIFLVIFLVLNFIIYQFFYIKMENLDKVDVKFRQKFVLNVKNADYEAIKTISSPQRPDVGTQYKKRGIVMFGCSYGYSFPYENIEQTFQYKLSEKLKVPVYNMAIPGYAPQIAIMQIRSHNYDEEIKNSNYALYTTIGEHFWRVHVNSNGWRSEYMWPTFDLKGNELKYHKSVFPIFESSYICKYLKKIIYAKIICHQIQENKAPEKVKKYMNDFLKIHFETILNDLKKVNPDIKLIILVYGDELGFYSKLPLWNDLEKEGVKVVILEKYLPEVADHDLNSEYRYPGDGHPSEKAWIEITNLMADKLKVFN